MATEKQVNYQFKLLYAIGMIAVVAGHCEDGGVSLFYEWFSPYAFHLALFAFASGYFYNSAAEQNVGKYLWKKTKSLLVPLYLWNVFYAGVAVVLAHFGFTMVKEVSWYTVLVSPLNDGHQFWYNVGSWFVAPLFAVQAGNVLVRGFARRCGLPVSEWLYFLGCMAVGTAGVYLASRGFGSGQWKMALLRAMYFVPFYGAGILYKTKLEKRDTLPGAVYFGGILLCTLVIVYRFGYVPYYIPSEMRVYEHGLFMPYIVGFLGVAFWLRVSRILTPALGRSRCVGLIADNTYSIMVNHLLAFSMVNLGFGMLSRFTPYCANFDWARFKSSVWYVFLPNGYTHFRVLFLIAGLAVPIAMQLGLDKGLAWAKKRLRRKKAAAAG